MTPVGRFSCSLQSSVTTIELVEEFLNVITDSESLSTSVERRLNELNGRGGLFSTGVMTDS